MSATTQRFVPPSAPQTKGFVTLISQHHTQTYEVENLMTIGRDRENTLPITDEFASARHARIERKDTGFYLRDLRSSNGTYVNGTKVMEAWLRDGDRISVGQTELIFSSQKDNAENKLLTSKNMLWNRQLSLLPGMAQSHFPVLILGPSGSGKEILARTIHSLSPRRNKPFVSVNCSALSESLVESELFGHVRGSFTGATSDRKGAFESARGGTLFLDEIGDLPMSLQPKLLRAIENSEIKPVGSDSCLRTDVRLVAATHHNLLNKIRMGQFREDLFFRLNVVQLKPPALKDRKEDFEDLLYLFAKEFRIGFSYGAIQVLKQHPWPGNIRELRNTVARAATLFKGRTVTEHDIELIIDHSTDGPVVQVPTHLPAGKGVHMLKEWEREWICSRLIANGGNQRKTAEDLGLPKSTLHDRIRTYNINIKELLGKA